MTGVAGLSPQGQGVRVGVGRWIGERSRVGQLGTHGSGEDPLSQYSQRMGLSWPQEGPEEARAGEEENLLQKEEVGGRPAVKYPPTGLLRENSNLWGYQMTPDFQETCEPMEAILTALRQGRPRECDRHSARTVLASAPTGSLP